MNTMNRNKFISGMGIGIVAGSALGMLISPRSRKSTVGRALKNMGSVIDNVSDMLK